MRTRSSSARATLLASALLFALVVPACTSYYKVTDPNSGKAYYTTDIDHPKHDSAVQFKDEKTQAEVTLQSSEIHKISKDEYKAAVK